MKLPRDLSGAQLVTALGNLGYAVTRQKGSHVRVTTTNSGEHHVTVPLHNPLKTGTLNGILKDVAQHLSLSREDLVKKLFG